MIRIGILDFDTSHVVEFTKRLNHIDCPPEQWVEGGKVVVGCPGQSQLSPERIPTYTEKLTSYGIPLVDKPEEMIGRVDAMLIEAVDGSVHWERAKPFLEAGIPCFVDKPFACSVADARKMIELAERKKVPLFSSSSLRFAPEIVNYLADSKHGPILGAFTFGPAATHPRNPGLFHYGIHAVEMLYTLMGPGCVRLTCSSQKDTDVVTGTWKDGRVATVRGNRTGGGAFGFTAFADKGPFTSSVGTSLIYRELLKAIITTFQTSRPPIDVRTSLEIVAFIEAANRSAAHHGSVESITI